MSAVGGTGHGSGRVLVKPPPSLPEGGRKNSFRPPSRNLIRVFPQEIADQVRDEGINPAMRDLPK